MNAVDRARRARPGIAAAVAVLMSVAIASACTSAGEDAAPGGSVQPANAAAPEGEGDPVPGGQLRVALTGQVDGLNPVQARWTLDGHFVGSSLFDTLMTFDEDRNLVPNLAESVTPNADGTVWTIRLRPGITFHDGSPVDAEAVKANIDARKAQPLTGGALDPIAEGPDGVVVTDPLTTTVTMSTPWFGYDATLAAQGGYLVAPSQIALGADSMTTAIGTGPFELVGRYTPGEPIEVQRNPDYWGDAAHLDGITFSFVGDDAARANALKAGDVDVILTQDATSITEFRGADGFEQVEDVAAEESFVMLNLATPPFDNVHARRALALATDRQTVVDLVGDGVKEPADGPFIEGERYHNPDAGYVDFDVEAARAEVEAYTRDTGEASLSFTLTGTPGESPAMEPLQAMWAAAGIDAQLDVMEATTYLTRLFLGDFQAAMFRNFAYVNPDSNYIFWHSSQAKGIGTGSINFGQLRSPELDEALETARATNDDAVRAEQYRSITPTLNASLPYIWLYHNDWALAADVRVGGLAEARALGFARNDAKTWWNDIWLREPS